MRKETEAKEKNRKGKEERGKKGEKDPESKTKYEEATERENIAVVSTLRGECSMFSRVVHFPPRRTCTFAIFCILFLHITSARRWEVGKGCVF